MCGGTRDGDEGRRERAYAPRVARSRARRRPSSVRPLQPRKRQAAIRKLGGTGIAAAAGQGGGSSSSSGPFGREGRFDHQATPLLRTSLVTRGLGGALRPESDRTSSSSAVRACRRASTSTIAPPSSCRRAGAFSTARASESQDARMARFSGPVRPVSFRRSSGCENSLEGPCSRSTRASDGLMSVLAWVEAGKLSFISVLPNRRLPQARQAGPRR